MSDLSLTVTPKSDQLNADSLIAGPMTIKIEKVEVRLGEKEQPVTIHYEGQNGAPYKPCKSMRRVMVSAWGTDGKLYAGRSMTLFCDPSVKWGGMEVGGIRISHMSHIERTLSIALTASKGSRKPYIVNPLVIAQRLPIERGGEVWAKIMNAIMSASDDDLRQKRIEQAVAKYDVSESELLAAFNDEVKAIGSSK
jgi:hypothetical protein